MVLLHRRMPTTHETPGSCLSARSARHNGLVVTSSQPSFPCTDASSFSALHAPCQSNFPHDPSATAFASALARPFARPSIPFTLTSFSLFRKNTRQCH